MVQVAKCFMLSVSNIFLHIIPVHERTTILHPLWKSFYRILWMVAFSSGR